MSKHILNLIEDGSIKKTIEIGSAQFSAAEAKKVSQEEYKVVAMEDSRQINPQFQMF